MKQIYAEKDKNKKVQEHRYLFKNPVEETGFFKERMAERIADSRIPLKTMVVFPDKTEICREGPQDPDTAVINRKEIIQTIKKDMENNRECLWEHQIDEIFHKIADESIELEKQYR